MPTDQIKMTLGQLGYEQYAIDIAISRVKIVSLKSVAIELKKLRQVSTFQAIQLDWYPSIETTNKLVNTGYFPELIDDIVSDFICVIRERKLIPIKTNEYFTAYAVKKLPCPSHQGKLDHWRIGKQVLILKSILGISNELFKEKLYFYKQLSIQSRHEKINHDWQFRKYLNTSVFQSCHSS